MKETKKSFEMIFIRKLKYLLPFLSLLFVTNCIQKYPIVSISEIENIKMKKSYIPQKQYILVNKLTLEENLDNDNGAKLLILLKEKEFNKANMLISNLSIQDFDKEYLNFCYGLYFFFEKEFSTALHYLNSSDINDYNYLKYTLIGDCMYELNILLDYKKYNIKEILNNYQRATDLCTSDLCNDIIKLHIKYAKYGRP